MISALLYLLLSSQISFAAENPDMYSDVYLEHFNTPVTLPWGDDIFFKNPGYVLRETEEGELATESDTLPEVTAIIYDSVNPMAIVDRHAVEIGSIVKGRKVVAIGKNYVLLEKGNSVVEINMESKRKKKTNDEGKAPSDISATIRESIEKSIPSFVPEQIKNVILK